MAESPAHKFGQIVGNVVEAAVEPLLTSVAKAYGLYLDRKGPRRVRSGNKVTWQDLRGNNHDLNFVLERGGTEDHRGTPVAFIESAWRRYTKHSRNKAQEIQGAIMPLVETHRMAGVFVGTILAGVFTEGAIGQLASLGFSVLYFPYETVIRAFRRAGINADFDEHTPDTEFGRKVRAWKALSQLQQRLVSSTLLKLNRKEVNNFLASLERAINRLIKTIRVFPLHGKPTEKDSVREAIVFIEQYVEEKSMAPLAKYEVQVRYSNGDRIDAEFQDKISAVSFLQNIQNRHG